MPGSAELQGARQLLRTRPEIFDFEPDSGLKLGQTKTKISRTVPTNWHTTIPNDSGPGSACSDDDPKLLNCGIAQPSWRQCLNTRHADGQISGSPNLLTSQSLGPWRSANLLKIIGFGARGATKPSQIHWVWGHGWHQII